MSDIQKPGSQGGALMQISSLQPNRLLSHGFYSKQAMPFKTVDDSLSVLILQDRVMNTLLRVPLKRVTGC